MATTISVCVCVCACVCVCVCVLTHPPHLYQVGYHDDCSGVLLPNHTPEIVHISLKKTKKTHTKTHTHTHTVNFILDDGSAGDTRAVHEL